MALLLVVSPWPGGCTAQENYQGLKAKDNVFVYDYADIFNDDFEKRFNKELIAFKDTTSNVIVVVSHPDFFGDAPWKFATDLGHAWGVAGAEKDNGIVVVLKPKVGNQRGEVHIAVGYGLEGAIPDALAKRIVEGEMIPRFKKDDYSGGVYYGTEVLKQLAAGEIKEYAPKSDVDKKEILFIIFFFLLFFGVVIGGLALKAHKYAKLNDLSFWAAWLLVAQQSRRHTGTYGRFSGGGGFGGGGGGSSFGGFGGGGFGGGGAGGSW